MCRFGRCLPGRTARGLAVYSILEDRRQVDLLKILWLS